MFHNTAWCSGRQCSMASFFLIPSLPLSIVSPCLILSVSTPFSFLNSYDILRPFVLLRIISEIWLSTSQLHKISLWSLNCSHQHWMSAFRFPSHSLCAAFVLSSFLSPSHSLSPTSSSPPLIVVSKSSSLISLTSSFSFLARAMRACLALVAAASAAVSPSSSTS